MGAFSNIKVKLLEAKSRLSWNQGVFDSRRAIEDVRQWAVSPVGEQFIKEQQIQMEETLDCAFGYHLATLTVFDIEDLCSDCKINHRFNVSPIALVQGVQSEFEQLPLPAESVDVVVLHHALDFSDNPHQVLREVTRALIPHGHLIVLGFNPWSMQGFAKFFRRLLNRGLWRYHSLSSSRVEDWMRLLDCDPVLLKRGFYRVPVNNPALLEKLTFLERWGARWKLPWGSYYLLVARKEVAGMRTIKPAWSKFKPAVGMVLGTKPSTRSTKPVQKIKS